MSSPPKPLFSAAAATTASSIKFLCSYGGRILPRPSDGHLRYVGGLTRVVSVPRSVSFSELQEKLHDLCGYTVTLRCQLPTEDLDVLVTIKSDEDLVNIIEEYNKFVLISGKETKIRAILSQPKSKQVISSSTPASPASSSSSSPDLSPASVGEPRRWSHRKPPLTAAIQRSIPRRVHQYNVMGDCYHNYYPCNMQANSRPPSSFYFSPQPYNLWQ